MVFLAVIAIVLVFTDTEFFMGVAQTGKTVVVVFAPRPVTLGVFFPAFCGTSRFEAAFVTARQGSAAAPICAGCPKNIDASAFCRSPI